MTVRWTVRTATGFPQKANPSLSAIKKTSLRMSFLYLLKEIKALSYVKFILPLKIYQQQADGISVKGLQSMQ